MIKSDEVISPMGDQMDDQGENEKLKNFASMNSPTEKDKQRRLESLDALYPPDPPDAIKRKSVLLGVAGFIIVTEFCERLAYYGFAGSLVLFFQTQLNYSNAEADVQYSAWSGVCYVTPLLGGYIADTYLGRYKSILVFCSIYLVGLVLVVLGSIPGDVSPALFFPAIYIIAIGTGGIKPNVSTMGADQFDDRYSKDRKEKESFFNWFYWAINLGSLISYTLVSYICQYGIPQLGGKEWGFFVGYMIPAIMMATAITIFVLGTPLYKIAQPKGSVLETAIMICFEAAWTKRKTRTGTKHILDKAKDSFGGSYSKSQVEGVKLVTRLTPFLFVMVPYWGIYSQMSTAFQNQGCQMDLKIGSAPVPVSALNSFDTIAILLLVPLFDGVVYPYFKKIGMPLTMLKKIGSGFFFAMLAMIVAALVEIYRQSLAPEPGYYDDVSARNNISPCQSIDDYNPYQYQDWQAGIGNVDKPQFCQQICDSFYVQQNITLLNMTCISCNLIPQTSKLSVFWQVPQFALIGISEILASITSLEFFYSQAPLAMRSVSQSLNLATTAVGSFLIIPLLLLVNSNPNDEWVPINIDTGHLDWYFFLLAALMLLTMVGFYYLARNYQYKHSSELVFEDENDMSNGVSAHSTDELVGNLINHNNNGSENQDNTYNHHSPQFERDRHSIEREEEATSEAYTQHYA
eukprot:gene11667-15622_t